MHSTKLTLQQIERNRHFSNSSDSLVCRSSKQHLQILPEATQDLGKLTCIYRCLSYLINLQARSWQRFHLAKIFYPIILSFVLVDVFIEEIVLRVENAFKLHFVYFFVVGRSCRTRSTIERNGPVDIGPTADREDLLISYSRVFRIWIWKCKVLRKYFSVKHQ